MDDVDEILNEDNVQNTQDEDVDMEDELEDGIEDVTHADEDEAGMDDDEQDDEDEDDEVNDDQDDDDDQEDDDDEDDEDDEDGINENENENDDDDDDGVEDGDGDEDENDDDDDEENENENEDEGSKSDLEDGDDFEVSVKGEEPATMSKLDKLHQFYTHLHHSGSLADSYNILPSAAIPIQTNVQALAMSKGLRYLFLGGSDGYVRKFDFLNTVDGKLSLTIQQKNALVDSIVNAGILNSYWENEVPQSLSKVKWQKQKSEYIPVVSPVHSLAVQNECLFILVGQETGGIVMQGVRYLEGTTSHYFKGHKSIVNHLLMNDDETKFLSGSWDKSIIEWDLETGAQLQKCTATSQLSSLEFRPINSKLKLPEPKDNSADADDDTNSLFGEDDEEEENEKQASSEDSDSKESDVISKQTLSLKTDENVFLTSCIDGNLQIWDKRLLSSNILRLGRNINTPPWCMSACWSADGEKVIAGRRNATVEVYDLRKPEIIESKLKLPSISGSVSCVKAMPNNKHVITASNDNIRIFDLNNIDKTPLIIPGHHGGCISNLYVDPTCRFMISTSGNRGWQGSATDVTLIYDIDLN